MDRFLKNCRGGYDPVQVACTLRKNHQNLVRTRTHTDTGPLKLPDGIGASRNYHATLRLNDRVLDLGSFANHSNLFSGVARILRSECRLPTAIQSRYAPLEWLSSDAIPT